MKQLPPFGDADILVLRGPKNPLDDQRPYAFHVELERSAADRLEPVATLFLTNRECPFRCLMCDLWQNTLDQPTPRAPLPAQLDYALQRLAPAPHIKLYNAGNFFDAAAVPPADRQAIAERVREHRTVVVENHPRLCGPAVAQFAGWLQGELEVAIGLETAHEPTLARLNKRMSVDDFCRAADRLLGDGQQLRTFVLLRPPGMSEPEGIDWGIRSVELSLQAGARCVSIVPVRGGNGVMEQLAAQGLFAPPSLAAAEAAMEAALRLCRPGLQRVFFDLWDWQRMPHCPACGPRRRDRLQQMNHTQQEPPPIECDRCG